MATAQIIDVFLCHATENREVVERVKSALEREVPARIFLNSIVPGGGIQAEIERAVEEAAVGNSCLKQILALCFFCWYPVRCLY